MVSKPLLKVLLFSPLLIESSLAKSMIDCRVVTSKAFTCNAYSQTLMMAEKISYDSSKQRFIRVKSLPLSQSVQKVISVEEMAQKYLNLQEPVEHPKEKTDIEKTDIEKTHIKTSISKDEVLHSAIDDIEHIALPKQPSPYKGYTKYSVVSGDMLSKLAQTFKVDIKTLAKYNHLKTNSMLKVGESLKIPLSPKIIHSLFSRSYTIEEGDTLGSIAKMFAITPKVLVELNNIKIYAQLKVGQTLKLPLPVKKQKKPRKKVTKKRRKNSLDMVHGLGKRALRVTATAYSSHTAQTDSTPFLAAWNNHLHPGMKVIAVSRDLLTRYGMKNGTKVRIGGLSGYYRVRDKMNKRYKKRIDIYMGIDRQRALRWGRRSVVIYW